MFSPFDLNNATDYARWRRWKLKHAICDADRLRVEIASPLALSAAEKNQIVELCSTSNMAIYALVGAERDKALVHALGEQLGLLRLDTNLRADEDSITSLEVRAQSGNQYIPYTDKALSWHTDGYYNTPAQQVRGIIMHCVRPAASGGVNQLLDPELLYIRLRDENPAYIDALMHAEAMTIPANIQEGSELRAAQSGPVFSLEPGSGCLHLRYSARQRNIEWRDDELTRQAAARTSELLAAGEMVVRHRLEAGQGIICNNVLHNRSGFADSAEQHRLMYRARYYDRVADTGLDRMSA
jgi:alpha-ketoglutarate-dependent taurine dioxygenase